MRVLLTFTGFHDPFSSSVVEGCRLAGPILSMAQEVGFGAFYLFDTPGTRRNTEETVQALASRFPEAAVTVHQFDDLVDPTDHVGILRDLRRCMPEVLQKHESDEFLISISSGTPSMHACWLVMPQ